MASPNFAAGILADIQRQRQQASQMQQKILEARLQQQTQQLDPSKILSQLQLMNIMKQMQGQGSMGQIGQQGQIGAPIDLSRPAIAGPGGAFSTEKTITVGADGRFFNIPTIINGQEVSPEQAIAHAKKTGQHLGVFNTQAEAEQAARARSQRIGQLRGPQEQPPPQFIQIPDPQNLYGLPKTVKNPAYDLWIKKQAEARKGLAGESAGKLTMLQQALTDLEEVEKQLFTPEGKFKRRAAFAANIPGGRLPVLGRLIPDVGFGTQARVINSRINNALEAKLRIETGAAATQEEFERLQARFGITGFDTAQSAKNKLRRLKEFMKSATVTIDPTGKFTYKTTDNILNRELNSPLYNLKNKYGLE